MLKSTFVATFIAMVSAPAHAAVIAVSDADLTLTPVFGSVWNFSMSIDIADPLVAGGIYDNPLLNSFSYRISGEPGIPSPSGFGAFDLRRTMDNAEFLAQGSRLEFGISGSADLSDGLQVSELDYFGMDAREFGTGRYHPFLFGISADGLGVLQNSNNNGGINPATFQEVDVDYGEEYIIDLTLDPTFSLAAAPVTPVPVPASFPLLLAGLGGLFALRRSRT